MPQITLQAPFTKNTGLLYSAQEIKNSFLYGIKFSSSLPNQSKLNFSDEDIEFHVQAAQKELQNYLSVKFFRALYTEDLSFNSSDWVQWGFIKTTYQVVCPISIGGFLNTTKQVEYPRAWLSSRKESDEIQYHRSIYLVPSGSSGAVTSAALYPGLLPNLGYISAGFIPNYWSVKYVTGFDKVPADVMMAVGQFATISLLSIAGSNVLGMPGLASTSLSIDGLSQSLTSALNAFGERAKAISEDLQRKLPILLGTYRGINFSAC